MAVNPETEFQPERAAADAEKRRGTGSSVADEQLDRSLVSGIAWTAVMRWLSQVISWIATFFAARLLAPGDYGIVAMATIAVGLARMIEDFGLDAILVQDRNLSPETHRQLAGLVVAVGVALCAMFVAMADFIAEFFDEPKVWAAVVGLSLLLITDALQVLPRALLQRDLAYSRLAIAQFLQVAVTQAVLLATAVAGLGYLALVFNSLAGAVAVTVLLFLWRPYRPRWPRHFASLAGPLRQGWRMIATRVAYYAYSNADQTIIGRVLGKDALGAYSFSVTFATLPLQEVGPVVTRVVPGIFSEVQDRRDELRRYFLLLTEFLSYLMFPLAVGMALTADLFVPLFLGEQWDAVVSPLRVLCGFVVFSSAMLLISHVMLWTGQFRANMWCTLLTTAVLPLGFWFSVDRGLTAIAWTWAALYPITNIPPLVLGFRTLRTTVWEWLAALIPAGVACASMAFIVIAVRSALPESLAPVTELGVTVSLGALIYCATVWFVFGARVRAILDIVRPRARNDARSETQQ